MKGLETVFGGWRRVALVVALAAFSFLGAAWLASQAQAAETIYWDNFDPPSIGFAGGDGMGGGALNLTGISLRAPEGLTFDAAQGRLYAAEFIDDQIDWVDVDGSGGGVLSTPGVEPERPVGVTIDPRTQIIYWSNDDVPGSIGWAHLDGSGGGILNTTGASIERPGRLAIDLADNRIYWVNNTLPPDSFSFAALDGSGGGNVLLSGGAPMPATVNGINVDPAAGRLYWMEDGGQNGVKWTSLSGVGGGEIPLVAPVFNRPFGMAFDPVASRFYWGNFGNKEERIDALGTTTLAGPPSGISPTAAPVSDPQDPVILQSPRGAGAPQVTQSGAELSCSQGSWSQDYPGSNVFGAPLTYSYQWSLNGQPIAGATATTLTATAPGVYGCTVTGTNSAGSGSQASSNGATVTPPTLSLTAAVHVIKAKAGKAGSVKLSVFNSGQLASAPAQICAQLTKKAKKGLLTPKCVPLVALAPGASSAATLKVATRKSAEGIFKFTVGLKGATVAPVSLSAKVAPAKPPKPPKKKR